MSTSERPHMPSDGLPVGFRRALFGLILLLGVLSRLYGIGEPFSDYRTDRQYHSALLARAFYFDVASNVDPVLKRVADFNRDRTFRVEPPISEVLVAQGYRLAGGEKPWVPRALTCAWWLLGGVLLYRLGCRVAGADGALVGFAYYVFNPLSVTLSRSFMPESLLLAAYLGALLALVRHVERATRRSLVIAGVAAGVAILVKPGFTVLPICLSYLFLAWQRLGWRRVFLGTDSYLYGFLALLPSAIFVVTTNRSDSGASLAPSLFTPELFGQVFFWAGWVGCLEKALTLSGLAVGLVGVGILLRERWQGLALGMLLGYLPFALVLNWTTATHEYYHAQVIPLIALGLARVGQSVWSGCAEALRARWLQAATLAAAAAWMVLGLERSPLRHEERGSSDYEQVAAEIGRITGHTTQAVVLDYDLGRALYYHAGISGWQWPDEMQIEREVAEGLPRLDAAERFQREFAPHKPEYFVVCRNLRELDRQPDLRAFLEGRVPVVARSSRYIIFDLRPLFP